MPWEGKKFVWLPLFNSSARWQGGLVNSHFCSQIEESKQGDVQGFMEPRHIIRHYHSCHHPEALLPRKTLNVEDHHLSLRELAANLHPRIAFTWKSRLMYYVQFSDVYILCSFESINKSGSGGHKGWGCCQGGHQWRGGRMLTSLKDSILPWHYSLWTKSWLASTHSVVLSFHLLTMVLETLFHFFIFIPPPPCVDSSNDIQLPSICLWFNYNSYC